MPRRPSIHSADVIPDRSKEVIRPNEGPQTAFLSTVADIAIFGGSAGCGKTRGLLMEAMRHSHNPDYRATLFRRTLKQIQKQGSLWDSAEELYPKTGARPNLNSLTWKWPSGAEVQMAGLEFEKSIDNYLGAQIDMMGFDELSTFTKKQFVWLISRNRGRSGVQPYVRATTNPDADSWVAKWVEWYINQETGYPITSRSGKIRWVAVVNDKVEWASSRGELVERFGPETLPKSFTFIPALLDDNPPLLANNPGYRASLRMLPAVDNLRLEKGNWKVRAEAGKVFSRFWFKPCPTPLGPGAVDCRFWDLASTEKKTKGDDPDFTAGTLVRKVGTRYHVLDCVAAQDAPADVEELMTTVARQDALRAQRDGARYMLRWEIEPGSASIRETARLVAKFAGLDARGVTPREHGAVSGKWDKIARAGPLAAQARAGNVFVCPDTWPEREESITIDDFLAEMHGFPDRPHDDVCLHGDSLVATETGLKQIRTVRAADRVWTRAGLRRVLWSGMTAPDARLCRLTTQDGNSLLATAAHPVWVEGRGFVRLDAVCGSDKILRWHNQPKSSSSGAGPIGDTRTPATATCACTSGTTGATGGRRPHCTATSGPTDTAPSRPGTKFTTGTATHLTTESPTSSASPSPNTGAWSACETPSPCPPSTSGSSAPLRPAGTAPRPAWSGTASTPASPGSASASTGTAASRADGGSSRGARTPNTAPNTPGTSGPQPTGKIRPDAARSAARGLWGTDGLALVPAFVARVCVTGIRAPVYNLRVEGEAEFFANGILVHNCDGASGAFNCLPSILSDPTGDDFTVGEAVMPQAWNFW